MHRYTSAVGQNGSQLTVSAGYVCPRLLSRGPAQKINGKEPPAMMNVEALAAAAKSSGGNPYLFPIIIVALFGLLYFVMIRPQRNRQRAAQQIGRASCRERGYVAGGGGAVRDKQEE